jgi:PEP-CTERM motif
MNGHFTLSRGTSCRGFCRTLLLSGLSLAGTLCIGSPAFAQFTYGTYISGSYYDGGVAQNSFATPGGFNYGNQVLSQTNNVSDPNYPNASASATANLSSNQLSLSLSGSDTFTSAEAEMWDTLTFGNLPSPTSVPGGVLLGTLNMSVTASVGTATYGVNAFSAWGLETFYPSSFGSNFNGSDCGLVSSYYQCGVGWVDQQSNGLLGANGVPTATFAAGTYNYSINIYSDFLDPNGQISFISAIAAQNSSDPSLSPNLTIDPSITLTNLYSGVTVLSASGYNYSGVAAVPEPETYAMLMAGLGVLGLMARRRKQKHA